MQNNLNIQVFSSCNCDCSFCHFKDDSRNKINPDFVLKYINNNPHINYILLTGGEPTFAINEYKEIIKSLDTKSKKIILQTNGWWGYNDDIKGIIKNNPPSLVHLSVDYEKQKRISIDTVKSTYDFLKENGIPVKVFNHTNSEDEYNYYAGVFDVVCKAKICNKEDGRSYDCGTALLATNNVGNINIEGWR